MIDIVCPSGNEKEFVEMALRLGWKKLCLAYEKPTDVSSFKREGIELLSGVFVSRGKEDKFKGKADLLIAKTSDPDEIRLLAERGIVDVITGIESAKRPDFMHHRNSGVNHIMCRIMAEKDISMVFDFSSLLSSNGRSRAVILGRMKQNIGFAKKYKISFYVASFASDPYRMRSPEAFRSVLNVLSAKL